MLGTQVFSHLLARSFPDSLLPSYIVDIYRYKIAGSGSWVRLTRFTDVAGFKASNPVVSDDGKYMAFQESRSNVAAGVGFGIYVFDLAAAGYYTPPKKVQ